MPTHPERRNISKLLDAVSSLKRAAGVPHCEFLPDQWQEGTCHVFTQVDRNSAEILTNLLRQAFASGHTPVYWNKHPGKGPHTTIKNKELEFEVWDINFPATANTSPVLADKVNKLAQTLIAPDKTRHPILNQRL